MKNLLKINHTSSLKKGLICILNSTELTVLKYSIQLNFEKSACVECGKDCIFAMYVLENTAELLLFIWPRYFQIADSAKQVFLQFKILLLT